MSNFICIQKNWDSRGVEMEYKLLDIMTNGVCSFSPSHLRGLMQSKKVEVENLELDKNGNIVERPIKRGTKSSCESNDKYMNMIANCIANKQRQEMTEQNQMNAMEQQLVSQIKSWQPRIRKIIDLLDYICTNDKRTWQRGYEITFGSYDSVLFSLRSEGVHHFLGGYQRRNSTDKTIYLGIVAGGFSGSVDFYTDGEIVHYNKDMGINAFGLREFVEEFEMFEQSFYQWVTKTYGGK